MKIIIKKLESFLKISLFLCLLLVTSVSSEELNTEKWVKRCIEDTKTCIIAIKYDVNVDGSDKKETYSTLFIRMGVNSKKEIVPVLFARLPLNTDLKKSPSARVGEVVFLNLAYSSCTVNQGCTTQNTINEKAINLLKAGKEIIIIFADLSINQNIRIKFPLKGFTKAYNSLAK